MKKQIIFFVNACKRHWFLWSSSSTAISFQKWPLGWPLILKTRSMAGFVCCGEIFVVGPLSTLTVLESLTNFPTASSPLPNFLYHINFKANWYNIFIQEQPWRTISTKIIKISYPYLILVLMLCQMSLLAFYHIWINLICIFVLFC